MNLYIYSNVDNLTENYHHYGGAVVVTDGDPLVDLRRETGLESTPTAAPLKLTVTNASPQVFIFPDAGCC